MRLQRNCIEVYNKWLLTFGGMWRWRRVAVARVFALVMRCRIMRLLLYSRVGKNRDTRREAPAGAGAACTAINCLSFWPEDSRGAEANDIYRPVRARIYSFVFYWVFWLNPIWKKWEQYIGKLRLGHQYLLLKTLKVQLLFLLQE